MRSRRCGHDDDDDDDDDDQVLLLPVLAAAAVAVEEDRITVAYIRAQTFFAKHHAYSAVAHEQGIHYLSRRLNQILENHIRLHMPEISKRVKYLLREAYEVQERYGGECGQVFCLPACLPACLPLLG